MQFADAVRARHMTRTYLPDEPVPRDTIDALLRLALRAPSAGNTQGWRFLVLDAAMNDLIRPALYEAWHEIVPLRQPRIGAPTEPVDIVGPVCETGDTFATQRALPPVTEGELVAILSAGAYGAAMSSTYNSRLLIPEILVGNGEFAAVRARQSYDDLLSQDTIPGWLGGADRARGAA